MAASVVSICNMALNTIGANAGIDDLNEDSAEARACKLWYTQCRDDLLTEGPWPVATTTATLNRISGLTPLRRTYGYTLPSDCLEVVEAYTGTLIDAPESRIRFEFEQYNGVRILVSDETSLDIVYTAQITDPTQWKPAFIEALAAGLAAKLALALEKGDPLALRDRYAHERQRALANALNEIPLEPDPLPRSIAARGGW